MKSSKKSTSSFRPLLMANWKMSLLHSEATRVAKTFVKMSTSLAEDVDLIICPTFTSLSAVGRVLQDTHIALGAQDVFWEEKGSYTGEVSVAQLMELGVTHVILGHSERRQHVGETNDIVNRKLLAVVRHGLTPILCVGETTEERRTGQQDRIVSEQIRRAFQNVRPPSGNQQFVVAYEPIWAIGSGEPCDPQEAVRMAEVIHYALLELYDEHVLRDTIRITYGGSVTAVNVRSYIGPTAMHGALVGGASLDPDSFLAMTEAVAPRDVFVASARVPHKHSSTNAQRHQQKQRRVFSQRRRTQTRSRRTKK
jgi:triosephosphate isomerase